MASKSVKFSLPLLLFVCLGGLFYYLEYRDIYYISQALTLKPDFSPMTSGKRTGTANTANNHGANAQYAHSDHDTFHVDKFKLVNDRLEMQGYYKDNENNKEVNANSSEAQKLILKIEGLSDLINKLKPKIFTDDKFVEASLSGKKYFETQRRNTKCNCNAIFKDDQKEILRAQAIDRYINETLGPNDYVELTSNCSEFKQERGYIMEPLTQVEEDFPIAFSILMFKAVEQSERLLRAIYQPQNFYCIHIDSKSDQSIYDAMKSVANCFDNVFLTSTRYDVQWGKMTVLEPDLECMALLYNKSSSWKYFINLTGQEFPLRTNYELVEILKAYNGANDIDGTRKRANTNRWTMAGKPPHDIIPSKGSLHVVASRGFVDFVLHDQRAKDFLDWCRKVEIPDEVFFTSLNHNPHLGVPGSYNGIPETFSADATNEKPFVARFKNWGDGVYDWPCRGTRVRLICVVGVGDLPLLATRKELFVNKLHYNYQPMAYDCLEELHFNHTRDVYLGKLTFDSQWYRNLGFVKNKVK